MVRQASGWTKINPAPRPARMVQAEALRLRLRSKCSENWKPSKALPEAPRDESVTAVYSAAVATTLLMSASSS